MTQGTRRRQHATATLFILAAAAIAVATLRSGATQHGTDDPTCLLCGDRGLADFTSNVLLFAPLGLALALRGYRLAAVLWIGFGYSFAVELAQVSFVAGRDATLGDLVANTVGTGAGWAALHAPRALRSPRSSRIAGIAAALLALVLLIGGLFLFAPASPHSTLYLQLTARFDNMEHYQGSVLRAKIGSVPLPSSGRLPDPVAVARAFERREPIAVSLAAGPPPATLAPIVSVFDVRQKEVFLLGAERGDVVFRYRSAGGAMGFDRPFVRFPRLLEGVMRGDTVRLELAAQPHALCVEVNGGRACRDTPAAGEVWMLLRDARAWSASARALVSIICVALVLAPAASLLRRRLDLAGLGIGATLALLVVPPALGFSATPPAHLLGVLLALLAGPMLRWLAATPPSSSARAVRPRRSDLLMPGSRGVR